MVWDSKAALSAYSVISCGSSGALSPLLHLAQTFNNVG